MYIYATELDHHQAKPFAESSLTDPQLHPWEEH